MNQRRLRPLILLPIVLLALISLPTSASAGPDHRKIVASDDCDPVSFTAVGIPCQGDGRTTLGDFIAQLTGPTNANGQVPNGAVKDWAFSRQTTHIEAGGKLTVVNRGGEGHTFTEVAAFGGGCITDPPILNAGQAPVPECTPTLPDGTPVAFVTTGFGPGTTFTVDRATLKPGVHKFQCLIHPWMQSTVTVED